MLFDRLFLRIIAKSLFSSLPSIFFLLTSLFGVFFNSCDILENTPSSTAVEEPRICCKVW